jgi:hypothetical protein
MVRSVYSLFVMVPTLMWAVGLGGKSAHAADEAVAASGPPLHVALLVSSSPPLCYGDGWSEAIRRLATLAAEDLNRRGGVRGRQIQVTFYDDGEDVGRAVENVRQALQQSDLLALVGLSRASQARQVFSAVGDQINASRLPFIAHTSVRSIFERYPNVFSTQPAQEVERVPVMVKFMEAIGVKSVGFLGRLDRAYIAAVADGLRIGLPPGGMTIDRRIGVRNTTRGEALDDAQFDAAIEEIRANPPEMLVVGVGAMLVDNVLRRLKAEKVTLPLFVVGYLSPDMLDRREPYPNAIYGIDFASVPEVESDRIFNILSRGDPRDWLFAGHTRVDPVTWARNDCDRFYGEERPDTFSSLNIGAVQRGALYADMVKLIAESAARAAEKRSNGRGVVEGRAIDVYRAAILEDLGKTYAVGRGRFKGLLENWSFHPDSRVRAQTPFVVILPEGLGRKQLAPTQFVRLRDGSLKTIETLYLDIDLIRAHSVDNNKKSFFAEFYLAMRVSEKFSIEDVTFTNAFLDPRALRDARANGREIAIEVIHPGGPSDAYPADMRIYKVSGRFRFTPDFSQYPFDTQQFSIDLQPKSGDKTFIIQPPPPELRDRNVISEGWEADAQYVSFIDDVVPVVDAFTHRPSIVPFYNVRYVWQMARETTDYYIRTLVPLAFILAVAYLSIFIPKTYLEAIVTLQVTALLSAVALYLSLPEIDTDVATISDRIFMLVYMMVSVMIMLSILRINARVSKIRWADGVLSFTHTFIVPGVLVFLFLYFTRSELLKGFAEMPIWKLIGITVG